MNIAVVNKSSRFPLSQLLVAIAAVALQVKRDFCPAWGLAPIEVVDGTTKPPPADAYVLVVADTCDDPQALGYHTETGDEPSAIVAVGPVLDNGGVLLNDPANVQTVSVASVLSHEVLELIADPDVNLFADGPDVAQGRSYAYEVCDPVQGRSYVIEVPQDGAPAIPVSVSDFVLPAWFDAEHAEGKTDFCGGIETPFTLDAGGYMVVRNGPGTEQQVMGEKKPSAWLLKMKAGNPLGRLAYRLTDADSVQPTPKEAVAPGAKAQVARKPAFTVIRKSVHRPGFQATRSIKVVI